MIEVFKTNITQKQKANSIAEELLQKIPGAKINFDLTDCDNILRIDCGADIIQMVTEHLHNRGFQCEVLE